MRVLRALLFGLVLPASASAAGWTALCASVYVMPANAPVGATLVVIADVFDCGGAKTNNVAPCLGMVVPPGTVAGCSTMTATGTAMIYQLSGPVPDCATNIDAGGRASYTWTYLAPNRCDIQLSVTFAGLIINPTPVTATRCSDTGWATVHDAELSVTVYTVPPVWSVGQTGQVIARVRNTGMARADALVPALAVDTAGGGAVSYVSGPSPATVASLNPGVEQFFTWAYASAAAGTVTFTATVTGTGQDPDGAALMADNLVGAVLATPAALSSTIHVVPSESVGYLKAFEIHLTLTNDGQSDADMVRPFPPLVAGPGLLEGMSCEGGRTCPITGEPDYASAIRIAGGGSRTFTWAYRSVREGQVSFSVSAWGEDYNSRLKMGSPLETVTLQLAVASVFSVTVTGAQLATVIQGQEIRVDIAVQAVSSTGTVLSGLTAFLDGNPALVRVTSVEPGLPRIFAEGVTLRTFTVSIVIDPFVPEGLRALTFRAEGYEDRPGGSPCVSVCQPTYLAVFSGDSGFRKGKYWCDRNPFRPRVDRKANMVFTVANRDAGRKFSVKVYNLSGELVRVVLDEALPAGVAMASWDGLNRGRQGVASGLYMVVLSGPGGTETRKLAVIK